MTDISTAGKRSPQAITPEQLARECLAEANNNPDRAIALGCQRAREIYLAQVKRLKAEYFKRIKRANERWRPMRGGNAS
jgi:hypothetical protein